MDYPPIPDFPIIIAGVNDNTASKSSSFSSTLHSDGGGNLLNRLFFGGNSNDKAKDLEDAKTVRDVLEKRGNAKDVKNLGFSRTDICSEGLMINDFMWRSFTLNDLIYLGLTWTDLIEMGIQQSYLARNNGMFVPKTLSCQLGVTGESLRRIGFTIRDVFRLRCTQEELRDLKFTVQTFVDMGMTRSDFINLNFPPAVWKQYFGLTKEHILDDFRFKKEEFTALKWSAIELEQILKFTSDDLHKAGMGFKIPFTFSPSSSSSKRKYAVD